MEENNKKELFENLQKYSFGGLFEKEKIKDKYVLNFFERNRKKKIKEDLIHESIDKRMNDYKPLIECLDKATVLFLNESDGVPDCIHYIKKTIIDYIEKYINDNSQKLIEGKTFTIDIPDNIFNDNKIFFKNCKISFEITLYAHKTPQKTTKDLLSGYADYDSFLEIYNDKQKLTNGVFTFRISEYECSWKSETSRLIYHEFTHAYQDYKMLLNNQDYKEGNNYLANKILYYNSNINLEKILKEPEKYKAIYGEYLNLVVDCCNAVYILNKMEQNAYVSQAYDEIANYFEKYRTNRTYEGAIAYTTAYEFLYNLSIFLEEVKRVNDEGLMIIGFTMASLKRDKVENEQECINEYKNLILNIEKTINTVYSKLAKMLGYYCSEKNILGNHGKMNDLYKRINKIYDKK